MSDNDIDHYNTKWERIIPQLPDGGDYRFDMRQYGHDIIKDAIPNGSKVFDFACGLGIIGKQLEDEKQCRVNGNDFSDVAISYVQMKCKGDYRKGSEIFGGNYDVIIAIQFLEHIDDPVKWLNDCFKHAPRVICAIPNNFRKIGEHTDMQWNNWESFEHLFNGFIFKRLDLGKYPQNISKAYHHPILEFKKKDNKMHPDEITKEDKKKVVIKKKKKIKPVKQETQKKEVKKESFAKKFKSKW